MRHISILNPALGGVARTLTARRYKEWIKSYFRKDGFSSTAVFEIIYEE